MRSDRPFGRRAIRCSLHLGMESVGGDRQTVECRHLGPDEIPFANESD